MGLTSYDMVPLAEAEDRLARVLSVRCPQCGSRPGRLCRSPSSRGGQSVQHAIRWDAWYIKHPEAAR